MPLHQFIDRLERYCRNLGVSVERRTMHVHVLGCTEADRIVLGTRLSKEQQVMTLAHEITHLLVHHNANPRIDRTVCEYEAHAVEGLVGAGLGLRGCVCRSAEAGELTDDLLATSVERVKRVSAILIGAALGRDSPRSVQPARGADRRPDPGSAQ